MTAQVSTKQSKWIDMYNSLEEFVTANGKLPTEAENADLVKWLEARQTEVINNSKSVSSERRKLLSIIPGWKDQIPAFDAAWMYMLDSLRQFVEEHGRYPEPSDAEHRKLHNWYIQQRTIKAAAKGDHWNSFKENLLQGLPLFFWSTNSAEYWEYRYQQAKREWPLPAKKSANKASMKLITWFGEQLNLYRQDKTLTDDQRIKLEELTGGRDKIIHEDTWAIQLANLQAFVEANGRYPEQFAIQKEEQDSYKWMCVQKKKRTRAKADGTSELAEEKQRILETVTNWTWEQDSLDFFKKMADNVFDVHTRYGEVKINKDMTPDDLRACKWYSYFKSKNSDLSEEKRGVYNSISARIEADKKSMVRGGAGAVAAE